MKDMSEMFERLAAKQQARSTTAVATSSTDVTLLNDDESKQNNISKKRDRNQCQKRKYTFRKRRPSKKKKQIKNHDLQSSESVKQVFQDRTSCCVKHFSEDDVVEFRSRYSNLSTENAKQMFVFNSLKNANGSTLYLNGKPCCIQCFAKMFGISKFKLKQAKKAIRNEVVPSTGWHGNTGNKKHTTRKSEAIAWMQVLLERDGQFAPNNTEIHLPCYNSWNDIFEQYSADMTKKKAPAYKTKVNFCNLIEQEFPTIILPKSTRLGKCDDCLQFKKEKAKLELKDTKGRNALDEKIKIHQQHHEKERAYYYYRREKAQQNPSDIECIIIDGAEAIQFPVMYPIPKSASSNVQKLKMGCYGLIAHGANTRMLKLIPPHFPGGANLACTVLYEACRQQIESNNRSRTLFVQADNCAKEAKNKYSIAFLAMLVHYGWFEEIFISTMIVGHTHADIDQMFSTYAKNLHQKDDRGVVETPQNFIDKIETWYCDGSTRPKASFLQRMFDWSTFFDGVVMNFEGISNYHGFRIFQTKEGHVALQVKLYNGDESSVFHGPDQTANTWYSIFVHNQIPKGEPALIETENSDEILQGIEGLFPHLADSSKDWMRQYKESKGKSIFNHQLSAKPEDFWLERIITPQVSSACVTTNANNNLTPTFCATIPSEHISKPPHKLVGDYEYGEWVAFDQNISHDAYGVGMIVSHTPLKVVEYSVNDDKISETPNDLFKAIEPSSILIRSFRINQDRKIHTIALNTIQKALSKLRNEPEKAHKRAPRRKSKQKK
ncbi:hypothetical protein C9374_001392 [Naegleria lovaniensis]|uniref:DUF7869 domain-containing protein n=1 Tax=Naegleria lovaniensis TaxID=51637 RepID=A0AA88GWT7_NAELO|nr:uncharacterized protein C9374_013751 [Naegleria lovaniensis]XP_044551790.1 uncharacterized protein C9374_001392 [Naegleria lovaniensis]KAG2370876.1 hypothetical protein C9374_013751 [Naegleria lovaniensis]KAG2387798.1 hypothetical protein C9374_001392 [Naegleria lovaniensis]